MPLAAGSGACRLESETSIVVDARAAISCRCRLAARNGMTGERARRHDHQDEGGLPFLLARPRHWPSIEDAANSARALRRKSHAEECSASVAGARLRLLRNVHASSRQSPSRARYSPLSFSMRVTGAVNTGTSGWAQRNCRAFEAPPAGRRSVCPSRAAFFSTSTADDRRIGGVASRGSTDGQPLVENRPEH